LVFFLAKDFEKDYDNDFRMSVGKIFFLSLDQKLLDADIPDYLKSAIGYDDAVA
jgi:hypothetical protein